MHHCRREILSVGVANKVGKHYLSRVIQTSRISLHQKCNFGQGILMSEILENSGPPLGFTTLAVNVPETTNYTTTNIWIWSCHYLCKKAFKPCAFPFPSCRNHITSENCPHMTHETSNLWKIGHNWQNAELQMRATLRHILAKVVTLIHNFSNVCTLETQKVPINYRLVSTVQGDTDDEKVPSARIWRRQTH